MALPGILSTRLNPVVRSSGGAVPRPFFAAGTGSRQRPGAKAPRNNRSKKGYTGTRAGLGRTPVGTVMRSGPQGPRAFGGATQLPRRGEAARAAVANRPSLMTRIGGRLKRTAAAFGF